MHKAYIKINRRDLTLICHASGHAGYNPTGDDIVCAGASMIVAGLAEVMSAAYTAGWIGDTAVVDVVDPVDVEISCVCDDEEAFGELARAFLFAATQYRLLSLKYPEYVDFDTEIKA